MSNDLPDYHLLQKDNHMNAMYPASDFIGIVEVPEENDFVYSQDFSRWRGIPAGRYSVYRFGADGFKLIAPGYGIAGDYGNGALLMRDSAKEAFAQFIELNGLTPVSSSAPAYSSAGS
jgi:hypothetical protein